MFAIFAKTRKNGQYTVIRFQSNVSGDLNS